MKKVFEFLARQIVVGNDLVFYKIKEGRYESCIQVINLTHPCCIGTKRPVRVHVEGYGVKYALRVVKSFCVEETLSWRGKDESQALFLRELLQIGLGGRTDGVRFQTLVDACKLNEKTALLKWHSRK